MASVTSGVSLLSLTGYAVLGILLAYLGLWVYRHLRSRVQSRFSLPKPVSGSSNKASLIPFNLAQSTGWNWRRWSLPRVPTWSKVPDAVMGKAKSVATAKNLNVELLPTTALPPPPTSVPAPSSASLPTPQLIDISVPATPPLTTGSTSASFPMSPRTPSPPSMHHTILSKPLYHTPMHTSYSRSPSPLSNLATSPQKSHRRSKSLGGVPIRRLSGGSSGLRNAMEMQDFSPNHTRGTSREHLLIDFTSSSSSEEDESEGGIIKISPAASDIGILPSGKEIPPRVDARTVGRHVPLVDLDDHDAAFVANAPRATTNDDEETWKWFTSATKIQTPQAGRFPGLTKLGQQQVIHPEPFVSILAKQIPVPVPEAISIDARRVELEGRHDEHEPVDVTTGSKALPKVDTKPSILIDLREDQLEGGGLPLDSLSRSCDVKEQEQQMVEAPRSRPPESPLIVKAAFSHPLETLVDVGTLSVIHHAVSMTPLQQQNEEVLDELPSFSFQPESIGDAHRVQDPQHEVLDTFMEFVAQSSTATSADSGSSPQTDLVDLKEPPVSEVWSWDEASSVDDPWANHTSIGALSLSPTTPDSDVFVYDGMDASVQSEPRSNEDLITFAEPSSDSSEVFVYDPESLVLEKSPGANLFATELLDEEGEMPALDLSEGLTKSVNPQTGSEIPEAEFHYPEEEEDATPKPTPVSVELKLPALPDDTIDDDHIFMNDVTLVESENLPKVDKVLYAEEHADPDFLPLPDSSLFKIEISETEPPSFLFDHGKRSTPSQTPTPPASPPPISPLRVFSSSNGAVKSTPPSPGAHPMDVTVSSRVCPPPSLTLVIGHSAKTSPAVALRELEDKENATPVALSSTSSKQILGTEPESVSSESRLEDSLSESLHLERRILADVVSATNIEGVDNDDTTLATTSLSTFDQEQKSTVNDKVDEFEHDSSLLPGTFPETIPTESQSVPAPTTPSIIGARLASASDVLTPFPSSRALVRSPLDIALAMQLRPGLGAGADPAWMVRFLMAMFGWFAVVVSGQAEF